MTTYNSNTDHVLQLFCYSLLLFFIYGCKSDNEPTYYETNALIFKDSLELVEREEKIFQVDSTEWLAGNIAELFEENGSEYISIFNPSQLTLNIYDNTTKLRFKSHKFQYEGPNGIGQKTNNIGLLMSDNFSPIIHNYSKSRLSIFDSNLNVIDVIQLYPPDDIYFSTIVGHTPPVKVGKFILFPNIFQGTVEDRPVKSENIPALLKVDMEDQKISTLSARSKVYDKEYRIAGDDSYCFVTYNKHQKLIVYNFRQDHNIYTLSAKNNLESHFVGSKYFSTIPALSDRFEDGLQKEYQQREAVRYHILTSPKYDKILYDPWRKLYYRFAFLPRTQEDYNAGRYNFKKSIIIIDEKFNKVGETIIPQGQYMTNIAFVSKEGLMIAKETENEDEIVFGVFEAKEK